MALLGKDQGKMTVDYKYSLTTKHKHCWNSADKLLTIFAVALNDYDIKMPVDRSNEKFQPKGSGLCGQFVCHFTETKIRETHGEGPGNIGHPNIPRINGRIGKMCHMIVHNKGFAAIHANKAAKLKEMIETRERKDA